MAHKNVTLIIAGGVSLGSYEAGVLTELLYTLEYLNARPDGDSYRIDVMAGGSAGSITAALVARIIMHDYAGMKHVLREAWVEKVDIEPLMEDSGPDSLLSNDVQYGLGRLYILGSDDYPLRKKAPATCAPDTLRLGFSISNMVGIDYGLPYEQVPGTPLLQQSFPSTFFSDFSTFEITADNQDDQSLWDSVVETGIASGSFPIAFPPVLMNRSRDRYPGAIPSGVEFLPDGIGFLDGGYFNNEPLRHAISMSTEQDGGILSDDRIFILIDPNLNTSQQDLRFTEQQDLATNIHRLIQMAMAEMQARDWLRVGRVNTRLQRRDGLVSELAYMVDSLPDDQIQQRLQSLKEQTDVILAGEPELDTPERRTDHLEERLRRIREHHQKAGAGIGQADSDAVRARKRELFEYVVLVLDYASGLGARAPMKLFVIGADDSKTAGDELRGFLGFFDQTWREHDYRLGRSKAFQRLPHILGSGEYPREPQDQATESYNPHYDNDPSWDDFHDVQIKDADPNKRKRFLDLAMDKIEVLLSGKPLELRKASRFGWALVPVVKWVIRSKLRGFLGLPGRKWYNPLSWFR